MRYWLRCTRTVSYTHLDVYKRQVVNGVGALDEVFTRIVEALQRGHAVG